MTKSQDDQEKPDENKEEQHESEVAQDAPETDIDADGEGDGESESVDAPTEEVVAEADEGAVDLDVDDTHEEVVDESLSDAETPDEPETDLTAEDETAEDETAQEPETETSDSSDIEEPEEEPEVVDTSAAGLATALAAAPLVAAGDDTAEAADTDTTDETDAEEVEDHDEHDDEEGQRSLASRVLTWLILLLVGGGVALWGGPKVAPHLPNGLGPVKAWLMPGALETDTRINALEDSINARFDDLELGVSQAEVDASVQTAVTAAEESVLATETRLDQAIVDLGDKVAAADSGEIEGRLAQIEARVEGLSSQLEALGGLANDTPGLSDEQLAQIDTFSAAVEGLRGEIGSLADAQGGLSQRIDDVEVTVERKLTEAEEEIVAVQTEAEAVKNSAVARAALTAIDAALGSGQPFEASLADLSANTDAPVPDAISAVAEAGVAPLGELRAGFPDAAHAAIQADVGTRDTASVGGRLASFLEAQVATRSLTPQEGDSTDAILSRAEDALRQDDLATAVTELAALADAPKAAMAGWTDSAAARVAAEAAVVEFGDTLAAQN